jgi:hypothetical protein
MPRDRSPGDLSMETRRIARNGGEASEALKAAIRRVS